MNSNEIAGRDLQQVFAAAQHSFSRRRFLAVGGAALAGFAGSSLLSACGASGGSSTKASDALTVGVYQEPDTLDPNATGLALSSLIASAIFDPLMWWLPNASGGNEYVPGLATSYTVSPDAKVYTFKLRQDVTFHDGTKFDAEAVKATFEHIADPATKSRSALGSLGPYKETKVLDPYTAQVVFSQPNAAFVHEMTTILFGMSSPTAIKKYGPTGFGNNPVGTGPFKFVSYATQDHISLEVNPAYKWGPATFGPAGPAKLKTLTFKILPDTNTRYSALRAGQLGMAMNLDPNNIQAIKKSGSFTHYNVPSTGQPYGYPLNVTKEPTNELAVRQAILHAVDQDKMNQTVLSGAYEPAHDLLTPTTPGFSKASSSLYPYDPEKAKSLLNGAGWQAGSGGVRSKNGKPLHLDILIQSSNGFDLPTQYIVNELQAVGFSANISAQPFLTAAASYNKGVQNMAAIFYYDVDPYFLQGLTGCNAIASGFNWGHYCQPAIDSALIHANGVVDAAARTIELENIATKLMQDATFLPLYNVSGVYSAVKNLAGLHFGVTGYALFHTAQLT
ncbi:MAG TPA: ABC transporter substrate-binding protein [Jatrophihabitans sp.]|jgi:peptide/nickel transport system substrate-binding protein